MASEDELTEVDAQLVVVWNEKNAFRKSNQVFQHQRLFGDAVRLVYEVKADPCCNRVKHGSSIPLNQSMLSISVVYSSIPIGPCL